MNTIGNTSKILEIDEVNRIPIIFMELLSKADKIDFPRPPSTGDTLKPPSQASYLVTTISKFQQQLGDVALMVNKGVVYLYNGTHWIPLDNVAMLSFLSKLALKYGVPNEKAKYHLFKEQLYKQLVSDVDFAKSRVNVDITKLNVKNGTLKIDRGQREMLKHNKEDYFYYVLDFDYDPNAKCPLWDKFIESTLPNEDVRFVLAENLGTAFISNEAKTFQSEVLMAWLGGGSNGKGVATKVISAVFGDNNVTSYGLQKLCADKGYYRSLIENKLLNIASESGRNMSNDHHLKVIASGEPIEGEVKFESPKIITNYAKVIVSFNKFPFGGDKSHGYYRRWKFIPFDNTVDEKEADKQLANKIIATELSGVLNWILDGLDRYMLQNGQFTQSDIIDNVAIKFITHDCSQIQFLYDKGYKVSDEERTSTNDLFGDYLIWAEKENIKMQGTKQSFGEVLNGKKLNGKLLITRPRGEGYKITTLNVVKEIY
tara:strand:- start:40 stop:1494 length:1455 start_codon:yes stop_codon:yes gene_type:complete